jgi:RNA polymerase sigma factor for flagellar operon FliA
MVERCARNLQRELGLSVAVLELEDLVQFGYVGLLEARERFDPGRGTDFRWFAHRRIRGAMLDGLRAMTRLPRRAHRLLRIADLTQDDDIQFGDSIEDALGAGRLFAQGGFLIVHSPYPPELVGDHGSLEDLVHDKQIAERIRSMVGELGEPAREIARRRLLGGESLATIAADMGISRPWAWRVLERACRALAARLLAA